MGVLRDKPLNKLSDENFGAVDDVKLRLTIGVLADRIDERAREIVYRTYQDDRIASIYRQIRRSGMYQHGGKSKVHRKIIEFPNYEVYDFVDTVMTQMFDKNWMSNPKALKHDLVRPWWVIEKL